jgi:cytochrome c peroxidase
MKLSAALRLTAMTICYIFFSRSALWALPLPLGKIPVPEPGNLSLFVKDKGAAIKLGKALFWDMQAGSDGIQACASCHFSAGADNRLTNQLHPGPAIIPATLPGFDIPGSGPNYTLQPGDFPFFQVSPVDGRLGLDPVTGLPLDPNTTIVRNVNDSVGSQGLSLADFLAVNAGSELDGGSAGLSPLFGVSRQVTGRNAPSVINAVFNYTNFWDGRANNIFNGASPLGPLDLNAGIWIDDGSASDLALQKIAIPNASLASQATGPPVSGVEMAFAGRSFPELGRKLLALSPLALQLVHPNDSVLGSPLAKGVLQPDGSVTGARGLNSSYRQMIQDAFPDAYWNSGKTVLLAAGPGETNNRFTQMEANFPLFWGLALQLYEATLVSDRTPFDRFLGGNTDSLSSSAQRGYLTFVDKCAVCHVGSELSSAVVGSNFPVCSPPDCNRTVFTNNTTQSLIRLDSDPVTFAAKLADTGFFNIGVRPTAEDPGRGAGEANGFPFPLSFTRLSLAQGLPFVTPKLPGGGVLAHTPNVVDGSFKVPGLRNVELTPPYFHNGSMATLDQVVEFYTRGGNFPGNPELSATMVPVRNLRGSPAKRGELVEFLKALTDERVRNQSAPFDHPELRIPSGDLAGTLLTLAATGGAPPVQAPALTITPFPAPGTAASLVFGGTVAALATVEVQVNSLPAAFATVTGTSWSLAVSGLPVGSNTLSFTARTPSGGLETQSLALIILPSASLSGAPLGGKTSQTGATLTVGGTGVVSYQYSLDAGAFGPDTPVATPIVLSALSDGSHTVSVLGRDASGNQQPATSPSSATWTVKATPPLLTMDPVSPLSGSTGLVLGGTVELGVTPTLQIDTGATAGRVTTIGGTGISRWSCSINGLVPGVNLITASARDVVANLSTVSTQVQVILPDGNLKGSGVVDISDALHALRIAVGLVQPSAADLLHGDVAPFLNGAPAPDGRIDIADALTILRKVVGLISF